MKYEIIVVGGGHAGIEASHIAAFKGHKTALVTMNKKNIGDFLFLHILLSSALKCLTSVFGMGTGEPLCYHHQYKYLLLIVLWKQDNVCHQIYYWYIIYEIKPSIY